MHGSLNLCNFVEYGAPPPSYSPPQVQPQVQQTTVIHHTVRKAGFILNYNEEK